MNLQGNNKAETDRKYLSEMKPVFIKKALFSDTTENYISPAEPNPYGTVSIRFRTARNNVDEVYLICRDEIVPMSKADSDRGYD